MRARGIRSYHRPTRLQEALALGAEGGIALAGGTRLLASQRQVSNLIDLTALGWDQVEPRRGDLSIGALATLQDVATSAAADEATLGLLPAACHAQAPGAALRHMATLGGEAVQRDPDSEVAAALLALNAIFHVERGTGALEIPALRFHRSAHEDLAGGALLREILIPGPSPHGVALQRLAPWPTAAPLVALVVTVTFAGDICRRVRIAVTGTNSTPARAFEAEACLEGTAGAPDAVARAALALGAQVPFRDDAHASASYRREVAALLLRRGLRHALTRGRARAALSSQPTSSGAAPPALPYFTSGRIDLTLDGRLRACQVEAGTSLFEALRTLGWGHLRQACDGGECGACVVRLDGRPVQSCLTLAVRAHGRGVQGFQVSAERDVPPGACGLCCPAPHPMQVDGAAWNALPCRCGPTALGLGSTPGEAFPW